MRTCLPRRKTARIKSSHRGEPRYPAAPICGWSEREIFGASINMAQRRFPEYPETVNKWLPNSWQQKTAQQQAIYADPSHVDQVVQSISRLPPLVTPWEVDALKAKLARAARGEMFVLQGGDCAESFEECDPAAIAAKLKILLQMSLVLIHAARKPVVRIGRI